MYMQEWVVSAQMGLLQRIENRQMICLGFGRQRGRLCSLRGKMVLETRRVVILVGF